MSPGAVLTEQDQPQQPVRVVCISYDELTDPTSKLTERIDQAYSARGLGILSVSGIPGLAAKRQRLLDLSEQLAALPDEVKALYADPTKGLRSIGWSHGVETLADGKPDMYKGSFYANPLLDEVTDDPELINAYPSYCSPNIWPERHLPELREAFRDLGGAIMRVGLMLTQRCDEYVASLNPGHEAGRLAAILRRSTNPKGRLLHYFPPVEGDNSNWCGWHTDHGSLTGLTAAMYHNDGREVPNPDPTSGLYIRDRFGEIVKATFPPDHVGYQMGEAMQVHSGGLLRATPHYVQTAKGAAARDVSRNTFAVFMQPRFDEPMDLPTGADAAKVGIGVWQPGITFGRFSELTVQKNYFKKE